MILKIKSLKWSAGLPVAMINHKTADKMGINTHDRILIKTLSKKPKEVSVLVDILGNGLAKENEVIVSNHAKSRC